MLDFEFPWWFVVLLYFLIFMRYFGIGALLGLILIYVLLSGSEREGKPRSRAWRILLSLLGGLSGGAANFLIFVAPTVFSGP